MSRRASISRWLTVNLRFKRDLRFRCFNFPRHESIDFARHTHTCIIYAQREIEGIDNARCKYTMHTNIHSSGVGGGAPGFWMNVKHWSARYTREYSILLNIFIHYEYTVDSLLLAYRCKYFFFVIILHAILYTCRGVFRKLKVRRRRTSCASAFIFIAPRTHSNKTIKPAFLLSLRHRSYVIHTSAMRMHMNAYNAGT